MIANIGDKIEWRFKDSDQYPKYIRGKTFQADVSIVCHLESCYGVYCEYGQDLIPFDKARIIKNDDRPMDNDC